MLEYRMPFEIGTPFDHFNTKHVRYLSFHNIGLVWYSSQDSRPSVYQNFSYVIDKSLLEILFVEAAIDIFC